MTQLVEALRALDLDAELDLVGRWARFRGEQGQVYVVEAATGCYYTWCDRLGERAVQFYADPVEAIRAGLGRTELEESGSGSVPDPG